MNWRHSGQLDVLAVQSWMHSLQKMCLQGRARTASAIGPRQMGHGSWWASGGPAHASRLLGAASRLMAAAALALRGSDDGSASCRAVGSLRASAPLLRPTSDGHLVCHWQEL